MIDKYGAYPRFDARIGAVNYLNLLEAFENRHPEYYSCHAGGVTDGGLHSADSQRLHSDF